MAKKVLAAGLFGVLVGVAFTGLPSALPQQFYFYGVVIFSLLALKLGASLLPQRSLLLPREELDAFRVVAIVPSYNEDPQALKACVQSLLNQTRVPDAIHVVDDGSIVPATPIEHPQVVWTHKENGGKRSAQGLVFQAEHDADLFVTVDSDTILDPGAIERLLAPFGDSRVMAATGLVRAANRNRNLLTRLIDLRYVSAFLAERAAYSRIGSVLCCCGSLAAYRGLVVREHLADFLDQRFLGKRQEFGDDRRLTNYALLRGRVVMVEDAVAYTLVPERFRHWVRQQVRWNKSFFRESLWAIQELPLNRPAVWLSILELALWVTFTLTLIVMVFLKPLVTGVFAGSYLLFVIVTSYARCVRYLEVGSVWTFLLAPIYGVAHILLLLPLRVYSLLTLRATGWGTRKVVEVGLERIKVTKAMLARRIAALGGGAVAAGWVLVGLVSAGAGVDAANGPNPYPGLDRSVLSPPRVSFYEATESDNEDQQPIEVAQDAPRPRAVRRSTAQPLAVLTSQPQTPVAFISLDEPPTPDSTPSPPTEPEPRPEPRPEPAPEPTIPPDPTEDPELLPTPQPTETQPTLPSRLLRGRHPNTEDIMRRTSLWRNQ